MKNDAASALAVLRQIPWLARHAPNLGPTLLREGVIERLAAGQWAQASGDIETGLTIVLEGAVNLFCEAPGVGLVQFNQIGTGGAVGQTMVFGGGPRIVTAVCAEPTTVLRVSDSAIIHITKSDPQIWRAIAALQHHNMRHMLQLVAYTIALAPRARLAARLIQLFRNRLTHDALPINQQDLAEMVGSTRKTVNGYLAEFQRAGLIKVEYGCIRLLDPAGLSRVIEVPKSSGTSE